MRRAFRDCLNGAGPSKTSLGKAHSSRLSPFSLSMHHIFKAFHIKEQPKFEEKLELWTFRIQKSAAIQFLIRITVNLRPGFNQSSQNEIYKDVLLNFF